MIFEASTTNHIDSAPAWLSSSFCAPRPAIKWISRAVHGATHAASPAQRKKKMRCAQEANVSTRAQRSGDAQGGTADDGPGVVSQVVSQVVKNAPAREAVAAGTAAREAAREAAEAMESSCHAPAWLEANPGAENGSMAETTAPSWDQAGEPGTASPARLVLRQRNRMQARVRVSLGYCTNLHRLPAGSPVPKVMLKLELQRWPRTSDACGPAP